MVGTQYVILSLLLGNPQSICFLNVILNVIIVIGVYLTVRTQCLRNEHLPSEALCRISGQSKKKKTKNIVEQQYKTRETIH